MKDNKNFNEKNNLNEDLNFMNIKGVEFRLNALNLQHTPSDPKCSATYLRNINGVISGPEYNSDSGIINPALYILDELETIKIRLHILFKKNTLKKDINGINVKINHKFFTSSVSQKFSFKKNTDDEQFFDVEIPKTAVKFCESKSFKYSDNLKIEFSSKDGESVTIFDKPMNLYFLKTRPTGEISIFEGNETKYPMVELMDILNFGGDLTNCKDLPDQLYSYDMLRFDPTAHPYSVCKTDVIDGFRISYIGIDLKKFINYIKEKKVIAVASEIYAMLLLYGFWLCGETANIAFARAVYNGYDVNNLGHSMILSKHLEAAGQPNKSVGKLTQVRYHAAVIDPTRVYDGSVRLKKSKINPNMPQPNNVDWSQYKNFIFGENNKSIFDGIIQDGYCKTFESDNVFLVIQQSQEN